MRTCCTKGNDDNIKLLSWTRKLIGTPAKIVTTLEDPVPSAYRLKWGPQKIWIARLMSQMRRLLRNNWILPKRRTVATMLLRFYANAIILSGCVPVIPRARLWTCTRPPCKCPACRTTVLHFIVGKSVAGWKRPNMTTGSGTISTLPALIFQQNTLTY